MIKANELRIGNWVFYGEPSPEGKHYIDVSAISKTGINGSYQRDADMDAEGIEYTPTFFEWVFEDLHPIPLSPEILEAAGFVKRKLRAWDSFIHETDGYVYLIDRKMNALSEPVKYLHQLQNLYFALTGEELTVKL